MIRRAATLHDVQTGAPLTYCPECGGEIYRYNQVADVGGQLVHVECIHPEDQEFFQAAPAISFIEETC